MLPLELERNDFGVKLNHLVSLAKPIQMWRSCELVQAGRL